MKTFAFVSILLLLPFFSNGQSIKLKTAVDSKNIKTCVRIDNEGRVADLRASKNMLKLVLKGYEPDCLSGLSSGVWRLLDDSGKGITLIPTDVKSTRRTVRLTLRSEDSTPLFFLDPSLKTRKEIREEATYLFDKCWKLQNGTTTIVFYTAP